MSNIKTIKVVDFPARLARLRRARGFTAQNKFADACGISQQAISKYEKGESDPNSSALLKMAAVLNVTTDYMLMGKDSKDEPCAVEFPVVGCAAAAVRMVGSSEDYDQTAPQVVRYEDCVVIDVVDDSMEPIARHGQHLLVDKNREVDHGDLVVADIGGHETEWVFKKYLQDGKHHQLHSINSQMELPAIILKKRPRIYKVVAILLDT